ncbi:MAG: succinylglutamate desuccinylase/aspartoacylase family protein [Gemmatimonadota bacterium]|nr:MAG: succinylglutamate desuccinylase/aspartoacylase family protein [Gemmatimonadota bacterium]
MYGTKGRPNDSSGTVPRVIGCTEGDPGPTLLCLGSLHGNEPAGVTALRRVFAHLEAAGPPIKGEFVGIAGNLVALARSQRYVDHDLNRCWTSDRIEHLRNRNRLRAGSAVEDAEQLEILSEVDKAMARARGDIFFLDLHTTSGNSPSFGTIADTLRNRAFALQFPVPIILGLEEHLEGTFLEYVNNRGYVTMGFEGGRHDDPNSIDRVEQCVWLALAATRILFRHDGMPQIKHAHAGLSAAGKLFPRVLEVRYRHAVAGGDGFQMEPGFVSFQTVQAGQLLARDRTGSLTAFEDGRILMPLYQSQGEDGYFLMREFSTLWLKLSAFLRLLHFDSVFRLLPGVRRSPADPNTLIIRRRTARWFALQVAHLLGYRKRRMDGETLIVTRRPE